MQRTTALLEVRKKMAITQPVRIEFWLAKKVDDLIYRMLVLNTGQVPWDLKRQLETLYKPIVEAVEAEVPSVRIIDLDQANRRSQGGEYRSTRMIELFLAYTSRSIDIDIKERVAEEFAKIDITEATANDEFLPTFITTIKLMTDLDKAFDRLTKETLVEAGDSGKIKSGRDIFTSVPASVGFVVAVAETLFGSPGFEYDMKEVKRILADIEQRVKRVCDHMNRLTQNKLATFLELGTLNERLNAKSSRIGEYERTLYKNAFKTLFAQTDKVLAQKSLAPCWHSR